MSRVLDHVNGHVIGHVIGSIGPASQASAEAARGKVAGAGAPMLERLAARLAGAQHTPAPRGANRRIVVVAGDHGCGDPGISMGADHPTIIAARAIADGSAALCQLARSSAGAATPIVLIDAGSREPAHMPGIAVQLGRGPTHDLMREPAMTPIDAALGLEAGIALAMSLAEPSPIAQPTAESRVEPTIAVPASLVEPSPIVMPASLAEPRGAGGAEHARGGLDVIALGALGVGAEVASAAILGAVTRRPVVGLADDVAEAASVHGAQAMATLPGLSAIELLATFGGAETAVLAGLILGCASINVPVILDGYATGAAAIIAVALAPPVAGYLVAAHRGTFTQPGILAHLGLEPIFDVGLGHGEGAGAAMVLPLIDQVAALASAR